MEFQSTAPVRGPTCAGTMKVAAVRISIHGPRAGADAAHPGTYLTSVISIHGPRAGADCRL